MSEIKEPRRGEAITANFARDIAREIKSLQIHAEPPLEVTQTSSGTLLRFTSAEFVVIKIKGAESGGKYPSAVCAPDGNGGFYEQFDCSGVPAS